MIHLLNLTYNIEEANEYFVKLKTEYQHLHWFYRKHHNEPEMIESKNYMDNVQGWGLQTIYADPSFPYHCDIDPHDEEPEHFKDTDMTFGFYQRLKQLFKDPYRSFLMTFPARHHIGKWLPTPPLHGKIFIPIKSNDNAVLISHKDTIQVLPFEEGKIYLIDMTQDHGEFRNDGDEAITFITFNVPKYTFDHVLNLEGFV